MNIGTSGEPDPINCGTVIGPPFAQAGLCNFQLTPIGGVDYETHEARLTFDNGSQFRGAIGGFRSTGADEFFFASTSLAAITSGTLSPLNGQFLGGSGQQVVVGPNIFSIALTNDDEETKWTCEVGLKGSDARGTSAKTGVSARACAHVALAMNRRAPGLKFRIAPRLKCSLRRKAARPLQFISLRTIRTLDK